MVWVGGREGRREGQGKGGVGFKGGGKDQRVAES